MGGKCCRDLEVTISDTEEEEDEQQQEQEQQQGHQEEQQDEQQQQQQVVESVNDYKEFGRYIAMEYIGGGKCGEVYRCIERFTGKVVVYESHPTIEENKVFLTTTCLLLESIKTPNPNVARFIESYPFRSTRGLVFEYIGTDLKKFITISNLSINPSMIKSFLLQMLSGVAFCHQYDIYHKDLKPENFLVDFDVGQLKLANFGLVKVSDSYFSYRAPEVLLDVDFEKSKVADMWSIGCIFAEMLTKSPLFTAETETVREQLISIFSLLGTPNEETWHGITPYLRSFDVYDFDFKSQNLAAKFPMLNAHGVELLSKMLRLDPKQRITANDACRHNYFFEP